MTIENLLAEMAQRLGMDTLMLDANGVCRLVLDGRTTVDLEPSSDGTMLYLYAVAGRVPAEDREGFLENLLDANYFGKGTGKALFSLDRVSNEVLLQQVFLLEGLDADLFMADFQRFIDLLEDWMVRINHGGDTIAEPGETAPSGGYDAGAGFMRV